MGQYLDFENKEKGFEPFQLTEKNIIANIGKVICYVNRVDLRGQYFVRHARIHGKRYSGLIISTDFDTIDIRDIKECGIKIEEKGKITFDEYFTRCECLLTHKRYSGYITELAFSGFYETGETVENAVKFFLKSHKVK